VLTPLPYGTVETWSITAWELLVFSITLLWGIRVVVEGQLSFPFNPLILPLLGLIVIALIQILPLTSASGRSTLSYDRYATTQAAIKTFAFLLFFLLFVSHVNTDERRLLVINILLGLAFVIALIGIGQSYIGKTLWQRGTFGPFVNRNHFAGFLEMGLGLAGGLLAGRSIRKERVAIYVTVIIALLAGLIVSASRGGMISFLAGAVFLAIIAWPQKSDAETGRQRSLLRMVAVGVLFVVMLVSVMLLAGSDELFENFAAISQETGTQQQTSVPEGDLFRRHDLWKATIRMIKDHPLPGVGLGAYPLAYTRYDPSSGLQRVEQAHNDYLQITADAGIPGGLLAILFLFFLFTRGLRAAQTRDRRRRAMIIGALIGCFSIAVHSFVDFNLQVTANAQIFLALAAIATLERNKSAE
jgi:O-antigen ligase